MPVRRENGMKKLLFPFLFTRCLYEIVRYRHFYRHVIINNNNNNNIVGYSIVVFLDIDECKSNACGPKANNTCKNFKGYYKCACGKDLSGMEEIRAVPVSNKL